MWKIYRDGFVRFTIPREYYTIPSDEQINMLNNYFINNFNLNLDNIKFIMFLNNWNRYDLTIDTYTNEKIEKKYKNFDDIPIELRFEHYNFDYIENIENIENNEITCTFIISSCY